MNTICHTTFAPIQVLPFLVIILIASGVCGKTALAEQPELINSSCKLPDDPREYHARFVKFRPPDGMTVHLNPPRFSWPYVPGLFPENGGYPAQQRFTFQVSKTEDFANPEVNVKDTPFNFYNTIPPLSSSGKWYWRIGYNIGTPKEKWSEALAFNIAPDAVVWDRSALADPGKFLKGHPRLCFNDENWEQIKALKDTNDECREIYESAIRIAESTLKKEWWDNFPKDDKKLGGYMAIGRDLTYVALAYRFTRDPRYAGFKERLLTMAAWPKGGYSSPEGAGAQDKWETHLTEYFGLMLDWLWDDFTESQRKVVIDSLNWRIEHTINSFAWHRKNGKRMGIGSVATLCSSHPFENLMTTIPGCIAIYEHSEVARLGLNLGINYLIGVTNGFGMDEGWNEGLGYGNGKMKWLMDAVSYCNTTFPDLHLEKNPLLADLGDFFCRVTPVGMQHGSWGNRGFNYKDWTAGRMCNMRRLAYIVGDGRFLTNFYNSQEALGRSDSSAFTFHHWIEYVLPFYYERPEQKLEDEYTKLFKIAGWVTASSQAPSSYEAYKDSVGITFHSRPAGGYSHAFWSDNSFDIYAYGEVIAHGGGSTMNRDRHANDSMSHNTVLVDGIGQYQDRVYRQKRAGHISAFKKGEDYVYWVGDATNAYQKVPYLKRFLRHVLFVKDRYFVIFDDLAVSKDHPSKFQWLYHFYPETDLNFDSEAFQFDYQIGKTRVKMAHIAGIEDLDFEDRGGMDGLVNPVTGMDYSEQWKQAGERKNRKLPVFAHNLWISNGAPVSEHQFMAVVFPYRDGEPEPKVTRLDDLTVRVEYPDGSDTISFDRNSTHQPNIVVDYKAVR
ncbi:DUF4962 domain-containing protein [Candidatus Poribacteria bacterium]